MDLTEYKEKFNADDASPGWDCIDQRLSEVYGDREPRHWASAPHYAVGGENPLDGISAYLSKNGGILHEHIITYGFSELYYNEEAFGGEYSKYGFELTFRLKVEKENEEINWAINLLQNIAKYVFKTGNYFDEFHFMPAKGPIRLEYDTRIHALGFLTDKELGKIETPHGKVKFLQVIGLTQIEFDSVKNMKRKLEDIFEKLSIGNPLLVTDLDRGEI